MSSQDACKFDACYLTPDSIHIIMLLGVWLQFFNRLLCLVNDRKGKIKHSMVLILPFRVQA